MNTKQILTIDQETNRTIKGWDIFSQNLVEQINKREYLVKGKYVVEDLTMDDEDIIPVYQCSCPDHQYRQVQCCHIIAVTFYNMNGA